MTCFEKFDKSLDVPTRITLVILLAPFYALGLWLGLVNLPKEDSP